MRVLVVTTNKDQADTISNCLDELNCERISIFDPTQNISDYSPHAIIIDLHDPVIIEHEVVMDMMTNSDDCIIYNDKNLVGADTDTISLWKSELCSKLSELAPAITRETPQKQLTPITILGASSGSVSELKQVFENTPADWQGAIVLIQHLKGEGFNIFREMVSDLAASAGLRCAEIESEHRVKPRTVYLVHPERSVSVKNGTELIAKPANRLHEYQPSIDFTAISLDGYMGEKGLVVLTGIGNDGVSGAAQAKTLKYVYVQNPDEAPAKAMPRSLIEAGLATRTLNASEVLGAIAANQR